MGRIKASTPGDMQALKRSLKESASGDKWFFRIAPDDELICRFMVEPYEFTKFMQHSVGSGKDFKSFPCSDGDCEGCDDGVESRAVWVAPVVDINESRVRVLQVPKGVMDSLTKRADKRGTILDCDWIIMREGSGKDNTKYDIDSNPPKRRNLDIYELPDIMAMLEAQLEEVTGVVDDDDDDEEEPPRRTKGARPSKKATKSVASARKRPSRAFDDDDDEEEAPPSRRVMKKTAATKKTVKRPVSPSRRSLRR